MVRWPGRTPAGTTCDDTINLVDMLATVSAVVEKPLPSGDAAEDSLNVLPTFLGAKLAKPIGDSMVSHSAEEKNVIEEDSEIAAKLQDLLSTQRAQGLSRKP